MMHLYSQSHRALFSCCTCDLITSTRLIRAVWWAARWWRLQQRGWRTWAARRGLFGTPTARPTALCHLRSADPPLDSKNWSGWSLCGQASRPSQGLRLRVFKHTDNVSCVKAQPGPTKWHMNNGPVNSPKITPLLFFWVLSAWSFWCVISHTNAMEKKMSGDIEQGLPK